MLKTHTKNGEKGENNRYMSKADISTIHIQSLFMDSHTGIIGASLGTGKIDRNESSKSHDFQSSA